MIYTKKANFPYPILMNFTDDYIDSEFEFDVELKDTIDEYILDIEWKVSSKYIQELIETEKAELILIIQSKDNQFYNLKCSKVIHQTIKKNKLTLNSRTVMQLMILSKEDLNFELNNDLNEFYNESKADITIKKGQVLGFSNTVVFDGSQEKPFDLFEKRIDKSMENDIEIELGDETIIIVYKDPKYQFADILNGKVFNYPYIYLGLQKALTMFLIHMVDNPNDIDDGVNIVELTPPENPLDLKLFTLMQSKNIMELSLDNLDEVIYRISDNMVGRYTEAIRGLQNGD